jgi:nucleoside-diphosphate-sugar epimerase
MSTVLITGAAGLIGSVLRQGFENEFELRGVDRRRAPAVERVDMTRRKAVERAFRGVDVVVDLAGESALETPWESVLKNNIAATTNALEAAHRMGARRVVFASSNHVVGMYERDPPYSAIVAGDYGAVDPEAIPMIGPAAPVRPDSAYALGKALGEAAGRYYADEFGLSVICLRIGTVLAENHPVTSRHFATLLTHADLVRLVRDAVSAPEDVCFAVYYGVSDNKWRFWDLENARREIGYAPQDDAESFR